MGIANTTAAPSTLSTTLLGDFLGQAKLMQHAEQQAAALRPETLMKLLFEPGMCGFELLHKHLAGLGKVQRRRPPIAANFSAFGEPALLQPIEKGDEIRFPGYPVSY